MTYTSRAVANSQSFAQSAALAMAPLLRLATISVSNWKIVDDEALTVSLNTPVAKLSVAGSFLTMTLANKTTGQGLAIRGAGGGVGIGAGTSPSPVNVSGDPQEVANLLSQTILGRLGGLIKAIRAVPDLPGQYSPIFLCPGRMDSAQLFSGGVQIISGGGAIGGEAGIGAILFFDNTLRTSIEIAFAESLGGPATAAAAFAITSLKAFALLWGLDYTSDIVSIGAGDMIYDVQSYPMNACLAAA